MLPKIKELRWKKLCKKELGNFQQITLCALKNSKDGYVSVMYSIPAGPCKELVASLKGKTKSRITFTHVLNKLLALAVAECPSHNQVLLDNRLYRIEGIHIANLLLLPGEEEAMTNLVLDNPHTKSLEQIAMEMEELRLAKVRSYERKQGEFSPGSVAFAKFFYRSGIYRLVSDRVMFRTGFERGMLSNLTLSNQIYAGRPGTFTVTRSITPILDCIVIHTSGAEKRPCAAGDAVVVRDMLPLTVTYHHSVLHGVHAHSFGLALERIASDPAKFLV